MKLIGLEWHVILHISFSVYKLKILNLALIIILLGHMLLHISLKLHIFTLYLNTCLFYLYIMDHVPFIVPRLSFGRLQ